MRSLLVAFAVAASVGCSTVARADDGLRCGEWLVTTGAAKAEVTAKCGAPTRTETQPRVSRTRWGTTRCTIDLWTYDRGPSEFVRTLAFMHDTLADVTVGDYGSH